MKNRTSIALAVMSVLGLGGHQTTAISPQLRAEQQQQITAVRNGTGSRAIRADLLGSFASGFLGGSMSDGGHPPKQWGMSQACARMVRKNRMHRMGIGHARI